MRTGRRKSRTDGVTRRSLLTTAATATAALVARTASGQGRPQSASRQGPGPSPLGTRSPAEQPKRLPSPTSSRTPLQDLHGTITPSDLHYERHHGGVPEVDPATYRLLVHGMVDRPTTFSLDDLKRFPATTRIC